MATKQKNNGKKPSISWKQTRICTTNQIMSFFFIFACIKSITVFVYFYNLCFIFLYIGLTVLKRVLWHHVFAPIFVFFLLVFILSTSLLPYVQWLTDWNRFWRVNNVSCSTTKENIFTWTRSPLFENLYSFGQAARAYMAIN